MNRLMSKRSLPIFASTLRQNPQSRMSALVFFRAHLSTPLFFLFLLSALSAAGSEASMAQTGVQSGKPSATTPKNAVAPVVDVKRTLTEVARRRASMVLSRYLPASDYFITVSAQGKSDSLGDMPYLPAAQTVDLLVNADTDELKGLYTELKVELRINKRIDPETRKTLATLVQEDLGIANETDIVVKEMQLEVAKAADPEIQRMLAKTEADLRQAQAELKQLERERNDLKTANLLKDAKKDEGEKKEPEVPKDTAEAAKTNAQADVPIMKRLIESMPLLLSIFIGAVFMIISAKLFSSSVRSIGTGVSSVAAALSGFGGNLNVKTEGEDGAPDKGAENGANAKAVPPAISNGASQGMDGKSIQERLQILHDDLLAAMNDRTEGILLASLTEFLLRPETVAKAVATLELLGKDKANNIFARLGKHAQTTVLEFLQTGNYGRSKFEVMLESGEELKTKILGEGFGRLRGEVSLKMTERILKLSAADIFDVLVVLPDQLRPRFMFYLESDTLAAILAKLTEQKHPALEKIIDQISGIADVEKAVELDDGIAEQVDKWLAGRKDNIHSKYIPYYQRLLESLDGDLAEKTVESLAGKNDTLKKSLAGFVVTLNTLFKLPQESRRALLDTLNNRQISALLIGVEEDRSTEIFACLNERRGGLVKDELEILRQQAPAASQKMFGEVKAAVIKKLKAMRDSGELQSLLDGAAVSTSGEGGESSGQNAA